MRLRVVAFALAAALAAPAPAQDAPERLSGLREEVERLAAERRRLAEDERGVLGRLDTLAAEARLHDARLEALQVEEDQVTRELAGLDARVAALDGELALQRNLLKDTLLLLHRAGPLGRVRIVVAAQDAREMAGALRLVHELTARRRDQTVEIRRRLEEIATLRDDRRRRLDEVARLETETAAVRDALGAAIGARRAFLAEIREQETIRGRAIGELERAGQELDELLARGGTGAVALDVRSFRGLLPMPAPGEVAAPFGDRRDPRLAVVLPHRGWDIAARFGAPVRSVFDGKVVWSSWFRGYGLMVVIDHGHGVHTVYAHLSAITVSKNDDVARGQFIGQVGDTGSLGGPLLYFEIRNAGKAEDPARWIRR